MIRVLPLLLALALPLPAAAQEALWLRYPAISPDGASIVFTYRGDLYRVATTGGSAVPLTTHAAHDFMPVWSRDGRQLAFASDRHGNFDIFVMPAAGGAPRRLTFHSADEFPWEFSADGSGVIFGGARLDAAASRLFPSGAQPELYQVPVAGGRPAQLLTTPAEEVSLSRDGRLVLYQDRTGGENAWRKHHTSAVARDIWLHDVRNGTHRRVTSFAGEDRSPVLVESDSAFYYLSEESGTFNVHRMRLAGGASERLTSFTGSPVRFLSRADDGTLAFAHDGRIYTLRPGAAPRAVPVTVAADGRPSETVVTFTDGVRELSVAPNGKEVAFVYRGDVFVANVDGGTTKQVTRTPEAESGVAFSPDSRTLLYASERDGRWGIYEARRRRDAEPYFYAATVITETPLMVNEQQNFQPVYSPDGKEIAFIEGFNRLRIYDTATRRVRTLLTEKELFSTGPGTHYEWSPDGRWILFDYSVPGLAPGEVGLVRADGSQPAVNLTLSGFNDFAATWILGGKAMLWRSNRDGLRTLAATGGSQTDAYAMFFTRDAWERFQLNKEDAALLKESESKAAKGAGADSAKRKVAPVEIELEGLEHRKARLTIHSSAMGGALVSPDGETLYYLARFERGMNLWSTNLRTRETKMVLALNASSGAMAWDSAQKQIFLLADGGISKVDPASAKRETVALRGELVVDGEAERAALFERVWRRTRDTYYTAGYHGIDWVALRPAYEKFLPHIANGHEFAELLSEMLGELNVSHSGARYVPQQEGADATASLGIFFDYGHTGPGVKVVEVVRGGPLDRAGMDVKPGTLIESIDGETVAADVDFARLLNRKAGRNVLLGLREGGATREVVVKPVTAGQENALLYQRWVRANREEVERLSNGRLGYVHVPGMNDGAYRSAFEEVMGRFAGREGVVVDARWNGGGDLVADLMMFLSGKQFFDYTTDTRSTGYEPNFRWTRPSISLVNEAAYSDGHCYAWAYRHLAVGKLVGMPVPGTCTFAGWELLQDGVRWGVPGMGVKDVASGRYLENWQTDPDIRVMNEYDQVNRGRDQQLEAAVQALLAQLGNPAR